MGTVCARAKVGRTKLSTSSTLLKVAPLQPDRVDLIERGTRLVHIECAGKAFRNESKVEAGTQFCCGLDHHDLVSCWGVTPPHPVGAETWTWRWLATRTT